MGSVGTCIVVSGARVGVGTSVDCDIDAAATGVVTVGPGTVGGVEGI